MNKNNDIGILLTRIAVAGVFLFAGITKLTHMDMVVGFFGSIGLVPFWAYVASIVETLAGLSILLGIFIAPSTVLLVITMVVAIFATDISRGFAAHELEILMLVLSIALYFTGAGKYALKKKAMAELTPTV
jgi:putative oxidoreductase